LINTIVEENPNIWTAEFKEDLVEKIKKGVDLEKRYAREALPKGIVGLGTDAIGKYLEHTADRRLERIGLKKVYNTENPFPWISEIMDMRKEKNFFETRVTEYRTGGQLDWS